MPDDFRYSEPRHRSDDRFVARRERDEDEFDDRPRFRRGLSDLFYPTEDEKNSAMLCHLLAIFLHFIGPIIIWASKKDESRFVDWHGREALNFSINMMIYNLAGGLVITAIAIVTCGIGAILIPLLFLVPIYALIMHIIAMNAAKRGELYRYPLIFRMIGPPDGTESIADQYSMPARTSAAGPTQPDSYAATAGPADYVPPSSGGGTVWVWIVGAVCLLLLLGCFGAIGAVVLVRTASSKPATSKSTRSTANDAGPRPGNQFPQAGPMGDWDKPENRRPVPPVPPRAGGPERPPKNVDPVQQALDDLSALDLFVRGRAADALARMKPDHPKRTEVARALEKLLHDPEAYPRQAAGRALSVWATRENVAALIDLLKEPSSDKTEIIRLLGEFKDDRAIKPLADALRANTLRLAAVDALKNFGPKAEDEVILVLDDRRFYAKQSACEVLKAIGTRKSLAPLEAVSKDRNRTTARIAQDALEAVRARNP